MTAKRGFAEEAQHLPAPAEGQKVYFDPDLSGFGVRVTEAGARAWIVQYRVGRGRAARQRRLTLGDVQHKRYLAAKREALEYLDAGRKAEDKGAELYVEESAALTLEAAIERYIADKLSAPRHSGIKPNTAKDTQRVLKSNLGDWYGRRLDTITRAEVRARNREIMARSESTARNTFGYLSMIYNHLNKEARLAEQTEPYTNPVRVLTDADEWAPKKRKSRIIAPEALARWWAATGKLDQDRARDYLRVCLLTAMRKSECAALLWSDVDFERRCYRVRGAEQVNTRTGAIIATPKNDRMIENPLTREVLGILRARDQAPDRDARFVFPGNVDRERYTKMDKAVVRVVAMSGIEWSIHDLRRTWRTFAASVAKIQPEETMRLMNHTAKEDGASGNVSYDYFAAPVEMMRAPAQAVEDAILACARPPVTDGKGKGGNVHALPRRVKVAA